MRYQFALFADEAGLSGVVAACITACAEGMGASASRRRSTVPPSTSTQRNIVRCAQGGRIVEQGTRLFGGRDIATEEDDAGGAHQLEPRAFEVGQLGAFEADYQQASSGAA